MLKAREQICHHHHQYCHYHNFPLNFLPRLPTCLPNTWAGLANELQSTDQLPEATETLFCFSISAFTFCISDFICCMKLLKNLLIGRLQLFTRNAIYICYLLWYKLVTANAMSDSQLQFITWGCLASLSDKIVLCGCNKNAELQWKVLDCRGGWSDRLSFLLTSTTSTTFWLWTTTSPPFQLCTTTPSVQM